MAIVQKMDTDGLLLDYEANSINIWKPSYPYTKITLTRRHFTNNQHKPEDSTSQYSTPYLPLAGHSLAEESARINMFA